MKYKIIIMLIVLTGARIALAQDNKRGIKTEPKAQDSKEVETVPTLPEKNTAEYWVVRSQTMTELIPFLTKKRTEIKKKRLLLADYLLKIDKADDFADRKMPIAYDPRVYAEILQIGEAFEKMNVEIPKERPSWEALVEFAMQHVIFEGYWPTDIEEGSETELYIAICKKKEEYGNKVRGDLRSLMDQSARMWVYLEQIKELGAFKAYVADLILEQEATKAKEKAMYTEKRRQEVIARTAEKEQQEFDDAQARAQFQSSRRSRYYGTRQSVLTYRQSRLDERFTNSRAYYY